MFADSLWVADVRDRAVEGDAVADINVEAVLAVGLVDPISVGHWERLPLFSISCVKQIALSRHVKELRASLSPHWIFSAQKSEGSHVCLDEIHQNQIIPSKEVKAVWL